MFKLINFSLKNLSNFLSFEGKILPVFYDQYRAHFVASNQKNFVGSMNKNIIKPNQSA